MEVHLSNSHHFHFHSPFHSHNSVSASASSSPHCFLQDTNRWRSSIPAFGNWEFYEELPITQYFEVHAKPSQHHHKKVRQSVKGTGAVVHQNQNPNPRQRQKQKQKQKQSKVCDVLPQTPPKRVKHPKAVDEDLYKIPPELLQQKPKRKRMLGNFLLGCIGMNCISS